MSRNWPATKATRVFAALIRIGWKHTRTKGSHKLLELPGRPPFPFAFHDGVEIGPRMLAQIAKRTGLRREDL